MNRPSFKYALVLIVEVVMLSFATSLVSCTGNGIEEGSSATYVQPSVDYRGRYRKGHVRFRVSTKKDAIKRRNASRYYYHTRGKYRRKSKKNN